MSNKKILIVEDDNKIAQLVKMYFEKEHWECTIVLSGSQGWQKFQTLKPDLVILDLMLPKLDGLQIAQKIRTISGTPIIMLTAKAEEIDKVLGLEIGADDYLTKPFSPKELVARAKAIFRRTQYEQKKQSPSYLQIHDLKIDKKKMKVKQKSKLIDLTPKEFNLLFTLATHPGQVFTRQKLIEQIYSYDDEMVYDRTIDAHIKNLRKKLHDDPQNPLYIESVFGIGYKFKEEK